MGFVVIVIMALYLLISIGVVVWAVSQAKKRGRSVIRWGLIAALVMYLIPFWDWIPTVVAHKYYCEKEAGFWVYKTLEQWEVENPGAMQTLRFQEVPQNIIERGDNFSKSTTFWNERINSTVKRQGKIFLNIWLREDEIVDAKTGEVLARYVDYSTSQEYRQAGWSGWKFWLDSEACNGGRDKAINFVRFVGQFKGAKK